MLALRALRLLPLLLSVLIGLTGFTLAQARGQARMGESFILCTGAGAVVVTLDANGNPTGPAHVCPDMALALLAGVAAAAPVLPVARLARSERLVATRAIASSPVSLPLGEPRGPPSLS
ncbi:MAG: hypothetical protein RLZZ528_2590 [Pseudomonadota bacterium]